MQITKETVSNHLRIVRELAGLSPEQASDKVAKHGLRISSSYIRRLEKAENSPTLEALLKLCEAYDIDPVKFFSSMRRSA